MALQMGNHDVLIEDNHRYLHELMGTIRHMNKDLQKLVNMNQRIHFQDSPVRDHPIRETSVVYLVKDPKGKQLE